MAFYDYKCKKCKTVFEVEHGMNEKYKGGCPKCDKWWLPFIKHKVSQVLYSPGIVYDDNLKIGGYSVVDKRHQEGMYWDSRSAQLEAEETRRAMQEDGFKWAKKTAEADEKQLAKEYKPVSEKEALDLLKDPKRKQDVHVVNQPTKAEFELDK